MNTERAETYRLYRAALKKGVLVRQPCEVCGVELTHGHHDDYAKPLEVRWLCRPHHQEVHGLRPKEILGAKTVNVKATLDLLTFLDVLTERDGCTAGDIARLAVSASLADPQINADFWHEDLGEERSVVFPVDLEPDVHAEISQQAKDHGRYLGNQVGVAIRRVLLAECKEHIEREAGKVAA